MAWVSGRYKTYAEKSPLDPADLNAIQDSYLRANGLKASDFTGDAGLQDYGALNGTVYRRQTEVDDTEYSFSGGYILGGACNSQTTQFVTSGIGTDHYLEVYYSAMLKIAAGDAVDCAVFINGSQAAQSIFAGAEYIEKINLTGSGTYTVNAFPPEGIASSSYAYVSSSTVTNTEPVLLPGPMIFKVEGGGVHQVSVRYRLRSGTGPFYVKQKRLLVATRKLGE